MSQTLKSRISVIILITLLVSLVSTMSFAATDTETKPEETKQVEVKLNRKVYFEGDTYTFHNGNRVRKTYAEGEKGCGIISIIVPNKNKGIYVSGEGWISEDQIINTDKYITLEFEKVENGLNAKLNVNGEFVTVESNNNGIITYKDGILEAKGDGTTTINFTTKDGKEIEVLATVYDGNIELNVPEKSVSTTGKVTAEMVDKKVKVVAEGDAKETLKIETGAILGEEEGKGKFKTTVEEKEILGWDVNANGSATANKDGISAEGKATQTITLLQRLTLKLSERANASIDKEKVSAGAGGDASVNDNEIISGDAEMKYEYGADDPTVDANVDILDKNVISVEEKTVPVLSALRALLSRIK